MEPSAGSGQRYTFRQQLLQGLPFEHPRDLNDLRHRRASLLPAPELTLDQHTPANTLSLRLERLQDGIERDRNDGVLPPERAEGAHEEATDIWNELEGAYGEKQIDDAVFTLLMEDVDLQRRCLPTSASVEPASGGETSNAYHQAKIDLVAAGMRRQDTAAVIERAVQDFNLQPSQRLELEQLASQVAAGGIEPLHAYVFNEALYKAEHSPVLTIAALHNVLHPKDLADLTEDRDGWVGLAALIIRDNRRLSRDQTYGRWALERASDVLSRMELQPFQARVLRAESARADFLISEGGSIETHIQRHGVENEHDLRELRAGADPTYRDEFPELPEQL